MTVNKISCDRPKIIPWYNSLSGLKKIRLILLEEFLFLFLGLGDPGLKWMFSKPDLLQRVLPFHLRFGI